MFKITDVAREEIDKLKFRIGKNFIKIAPNDAFPTPLGEKWVPEPICLPSTYRYGAEEISNLTVRKDDIWVISAPKSGTTWISELLWIIANDFDFVKARNEHLSYRVPFLDGFHLFDKSAVKKDPAIDNSSEYKGNMTVPHAKALTQSFPYKTVKDMMDSRPSPRMLKSHLNLSTLPKQLWTVKPKIVYIARNVHDVAVSYFYHYEIMWLNEAVRIEDFLNAFMADNVMHAPFWDTVLSFWQMRNEENILFLMYEEMKTNLPEVIQKCCKFLDKTITEDQLKALAEYVSFDNLKKIETEERKFSGRSVERSLFRKGEIGSHKKEIPEEYAKKLTNWYQEKIAKWEEIYGKSNENYPFLTY